MGTYYAVPTAYTIGPRFSSFSDAQDAAVALIKPFDGIPGESRAFVDERVEDERGDHPIARWEIFSDGRAVRRRDV